MKTNKRWSAPSRLLKNTYIQAALVGLIAILPFTIYLAATHSILAPLNVIAGWDISAARGSVVTQTPSDVNQQILPFREYTKDSLTKYHEIPFWNNKSFSGDAFLANPINTGLSPFNLLLFWIDIYTFQNVIVLTGLFLMSACMYLLLRQTLLSVGASCLGAIAYCFAPFSIFWSIFGIISIPMAAIPLVLYFYEKWKQKIKLYNAYLLYIALTLGIVLYTGHIQISVLPYIVLSLYVCYDLLLHKLSVRKILYITSAMSVALVIGAAQIAPMMSQITPSHRSNELTTAIPETWNNRFKELAKIPQAYELSSGPNELGRTTGGVLSIGQIPGIFLIISMAVLLVEFSRRNMANVMFFYLFLFILGAFWKWNDFPQNILNTLSPTFKSLSTGYFLPIALVGMSVLSAYGLDWLLRNLFGKKSARIQVKPLTIMYMLPIFGIMALSVPQLMLSRVNTLNATYYTLYYVAIFLVLLLYIGRKNNKSSKAFFAVTIVVLALFQGWALYRVSQPIISSNILTIKNRELNYITSVDKNTPTILDYSNPQESGVYKISLLNGYDSLYSSSILERIKAINYPTVTLTTYRNNALIITDITKSNLFKNLGVTYAINNKPSTGYVEEINGVYKANQPTPQVYFAKKIKNITKMEQLQTIRTGAIDYHEVQIDGTHQVAAQNSTVSYHRTPNSLTLRTTSANGGLLFIAQTYNKDWKGVLNDSTSVRLLPADYDFSAIDVPSGSHTIVLKYQPLVITVSLWFSILAVLFTALALMLIKK